MRRIIVIFLSLGLIMAIALLALRFRLSAQVVSKVSDPNQTEGQLKHARLQQTQLQQVDPLQRAKSGTLLTMPPASLVAGGNRRPESTQPFALAADRQGYRVDAGPDGVVVRSSDGQGWQVAFGGPAQAVRQVADRLTVERDYGQEWYRLRPEGIEQGFVVEQRPNAGGGR